MSYWEWLKDWFTTSPSSRLKPFIKAPITEFFFGSLSGATFISFGLVYGFENHHYLLLLLGLIPCVLTILHAEYREAMRYK